MTPWLLIPVKSLVAGKGRLAHVLEQGERRILNEFLLRRMLETASRFPGSDRTAVISGCDDVLRLAEDCGVSTIRERFTHGLNAAAMQGVAALRERGAEEILLIACDVPLVRSEDLRDVGRRGARLRRVVICPDKHGTGTNAIFLPPQTTIEFQFGENSLFQHIHGAVRCGLKPYLNFNDHIAFDIDTPEDLAEWKRSCLVAEEMRELFERAGTKTEARMVTAIQSGLRATHGGNPS